MLFIDENYAEYVKFSVLDQRIFALDDRLGQGNALAKAKELQHQAFGNLMKVLFLAKREEILVRYSERRYEPFWHIHCRAHMEYHRSRDHTIACDPPVIRVVIDGREYMPADGRLVMSGTEFCSEDLSREIYVDAGDGKHRQYEKHVASPRTEIRETEELMADDVIVMPAKVKASTLTRNMLGEMLKPVKADDITEEEITIDILHLYYRPVYAFEYFWPSKNRTAVLELDAVTMEVTSGIAIRQKMKEVFSEADLFELGTDAVDIILPGGGIALRLARSLAKK